MSIRVTAVVLSVMATVSGAHGEDQRSASPRIASVDARGRVTPVQDEQPDSQRIDAFASGAPCKIGQPMATDEARALVLMIATDEGFFPDFVLAVAKNESGFNSITVSEKGAVGLMQLMPATAQRFKVDLCDPAGNVLGGIRFLRALHEKYRNPFFVLAAYNAGEDVVEKSRGVPAYPETVRFVAQVINDAYALPTPGASPRRGSRSLGPDTPDLIEPAAPSAAASTPGARSRAAWDDGFVMHID
ncbi:lytic transglycosylase domain-containing protein [Ancylobacter dichloromethanicus]|uniref:Transglycosylase SLT domain-containing protein n=1 Tax=Ancylobacter dichloromethanicus TaxID=518825 RepID=A0A9W6JA03_9HYPH|nr:lytic transglycosylase domain-containing protein [Ancylobacter dichloromethanicus]MBS7556393.1 lytic transglycosylase domain-containing protein [Ancylobacter dichloromethanicus]GLK73651.1 hypothetical protein GCM10017643_37690 [Ancylobacter dichloromethanicus]